MFFICGWINKLCCSSFYCALLLCFTDSVFSFKMKVCGKQVCQHYFSSSICTVHISVSAFGSSCSISNFFIICYGDLWAVAFDVTIVMLRGSTIDCTHIRWQSVDVGCVLTVPLTRQSLIFLPFLGPLFSLKRNNIAVGPINGLQWPPSVQVKGRVICLSLEIKRSSSVKTACQNPRQAES